MKNDSSCEINMFFPPTEIVPYLPVHVKLTTNIVNIQKERERNSDFVDGVIQRAPFILSTELR